MIGGPVTLVAGMVILLPVVTELAKPRCAALVHRQEGLDREVCRRHLQRRPEGGDHGEEADLAEGCAQVQRDHGLGRGAGRRIVREIGLDILDQLAEGRIGVLAAPSPQLRDQRRVAGCGHRRDLRQAARVDREPKHVDRGLEELGVDPVPEERRGAIGLDQVPETVDDQRRVRLVCLQQPAERLAQRPHHLAVVGLLQVGRSEAPCEQQAVALGDRQVEVLGEVDEELAARARAARLDEAQVLGGQVRVQRQLHLREPPLGAPEADELTDGLRLPLGLDGHRANGSARPDRLHYLGCNGERPFTSEVIDTRSFLGDRYRHEQRFQRRQPR